MTGHIFIEGEIGGEVTVKSVRADIAQYPNAKEWIIHTSSGGGDVYEGYNIGNIIAALPNTHAQIGAACCSIATYIAECCQTITMAPHGDWMIHLPTGQVQGNSKDFRRAAEQLDRIKSELADKYMTRVAKKGKLTREQVLGMIENETSMSPQEAMQFGFIDDVQEKLKAVAKFDITKFNDMETTLTKEQAEGMFTDFGKRLDTMFANFKKQFKNAVQIALADGTMATSSAESPEALVGAALTGPDGKPYPDGPIETADGYVITIAGGLVTAYEPKMEDNKDTNAEVEALKKQVEDLTNQLSTKTNEATQAVQAQAKLQTEFKNTIDNIKKEMNDLKSKTFGDPDPAPTDPNFRADAGQGGAQPDFMLIQMDAELAESFRTSRSTNFKNN